jgi:flavorubredoxin
MYDFLHHLEIKAFQRRRVALVENGSWAPSAAKTMRAMLEGMKQVDIVEPVVTLRGCLKDTDIPQLEALAEALLA